MSTQAAAASPTPNRPKGTPISPREYASRLEWRLLGDLSKAPSLKNWKFFHDLLPKTSEWMADLPASQHHHHDHAFGLIIHSLDTLRRYLKGISGDMVYSRNKAPKSIPEWWGIHSLSPKRRIHWYAIGACLALLHDVGKLFSFRVFNPGSRKAWDPFSEPLARYLGESLTGQPVGSKYEWVTGRGCFTHEKRGVYLVQGVFLPLIPMALRGHLYQVFELYRDRRQHLDPLRKYVEGQIVRLVIAADHASAREDQLGLTENILGRNDGTTC